VDYAELKTHLEGGIITLTALDAEDHLFPIAFAIVPTAEDEECCSFLFHRLKHCPCAVRDGPQCQALGHPAFRQWLGRRDMVIFSAQSQSFNNAICRHLSTALHV
jgi:hypothetical protein